MPKPRVMRLLQGYYFDPKARRYMRVGKPGFVSRAKILNLLEKSVAERERRLYEGVRRLADGRRSPQVFLSHAKRMLKRQYLQEAALAAGGWDRLTPADYGRAGGKLQAQYRRLTEMTRGIRDGEVSEAQALSRMQMYMGNARAEYFEVERQRLPIVPQGQARMERRTLGASKGGPCFPAGTQILTASGEKPIESIRIGEYIWTRYGLKAVTQTFAHLYMGGLVCVRAKGREVWCTPNHPFAVEENEWVMAGMLGDRNPVLFEDCAYPLKSHIAFPDALDGKSSNSKVLVSGRIPLPLCSLPRTQWLETRMAMPPIAIGFDDEPIADQGIDNELGLDQIMGLIRDAQRIEIGEQAQFQLGWLIALQLAMTFEERYHCSGPSFPSLKDLFSESLTRPWGMTRIVFAHSLSDVGIERLVINPVFAQSDLELLCPPLDSLNGHTESFRDGFRPFRRIPLINELIEFHGRSAAGLCRTWASRIENRSRGMFSTEGLLTVALMPTDRASLPAYALFVNRFGSAAHAESFSPVPSMSANRADLLVIPPRLPGKGTGTTTCLGRGRPGCEKLTAMSANLSSRLSLIHILFSPLHRHNGHAYPLYDASTELSNKGCMVYNLEVEHVHEYVAEGFVVHNCEDCEKWADMGWQGEGILPIPTQQSVCNGHCRCTLHRVVVDAERATAAMGTKGRP